MRRLAKYEKHRECWLEYKFDKIRPSNLPRRFQRFDFENHLRAGRVSDLGEGLGLLMVKSSRGVHPKPPFGPIMDSMVRIQYQHWVNPMHVYIYIHIHVHT